MNWIHIEDQKPEIGQKVFYYFGFYDKVYEGIYSQEYYNKELYPNCIMDCFSGKSGFLCDDVTFWMPCTKRDKIPDVPSDELKQREIFHKKEALQGGVK